MTIIWATRGKNWGFRFLSDGGEIDPLPSYLSAFENMETAGEFIRNQGGIVAARIFDPLGRQDHSGRVILHDFILRGSMSEGISTIDDVKAHIWPVVAEQYLESWRRLEPKL